MNMRLIHDSDKPLTQVHDALPQNGGWRGRGDKPKGLWVSVEGDMDWKQWCEAEGFGLNRLTCATEIVLHPDATVLHINGPQKLMAFHHAYLADHEPDTHRWERNFRIRWDDVADKYDGIIIAPYIGVLRLNNETSWYYGWDCASGCIWRGRAVAAVRPLEQSDTAAMTGEPV